MRLIECASIAELLEILAASCTFGGDGGGEQESAGLILTGGKTFTSNRQQPWAATVAIRDRRFVYIFERLMVGR